MTQASPPQTSTFQASIPQASPINQSTAADFHAAPQEETRFWARSRERASTKSSIIRKLAGLVVKFEGRDALVIFSTNEGPIEYYLPSDALRENGITVEQQPFEYLEGKKFTSNGRVQRFTELIPSAPADSAQIEALTLSPERAAKYDLIKKHFSKKV